MNDSEKKQRDIIGAALYEEDYDTLVHLTQEADYSSDPLVLLGCILSLLHMARRFGKFPQNLKDDLWQQSKKYPDAYGIAGAKHDALEEIQHCKAIGV